jgi:hypothetical protein
MPVSEVVVVEDPRRFPRRVEAELTRRHQDLLARASARGSARVLDLSDPAGRLLVADAVARPIDPEWDTVVSIAELIRFPDLALALKGIDRLLVPTGRFMAVEPVARPGTLRMLVVGPWVRSRALRGLHVGRDLPAALRSTTFTVDDIERFTMPTSVAPLRHFVAIDTRRARATNEIELSETMTREQT